MSSWRSSQDVANRRPPPPVPGSAAYRSLPPVRSVRRGRPGGPGGLRPGPDFGRGRGRGRLRQLLGAIFGAGSPLRHLDWILLAAVLALCTLGTLLVWSATATAGLNTSDPYLTKSILNIAIGLALMVGVSMLDYRQLRQYAPIVLAASCLGLIVVLLPLGSLTVPVNGSKSWISLGGGFQIEPSEYAKLSIILVGGMILGDISRRETRPKVRALAIMLAICVVPLLLVLAEPDLGVVIVMLALMIGMISLSGIRLRWLIALLAVGSAGAFGAIKLHLLKAYQLSRLTSFMHPSADPNGAGYSARQSEIAIGSGGLTGQGLFHGQLVAGGFVPEQHTDFIFAVAGDEIGFVGCLVIIALLAIVLLCAIRIAARADDQFGTLVAGGIAIWFAVQSFINIGMTVGIMPVTGVPLPFVSYGGSAIFADMIAIGALQAVHRHRSVFA
jgi:rod shape determining protein RodA